MLVIMLVDSAFFFAVTLGLAVAGMYCVIDAVGVGADSSDGEDAGPSLDLRTQCVANEGLRAICNASDAIGRIHFRDSEAAAENGAKKDAAEKKQKA